MKKDLWKILISLLIFGSNGVIARFISLNSYEIVFFRALLGSLLLLIIYLVTRHSFTFMKNKRDLLFVALAGLAMALNWLFLFEAYATIGVSLSLIINYCGPIIVIALSPIVFRERITIHKLIALAAALVGIVLISGDAVSMGLNPWGLICAVLSAVSYAFMVIFSKKTQKIVGFEFATLELLFTCLTMVIYIGIKQQFIISVAADDIVPILIIGFLNTGVACYLYFSTVPRLPVQTVAICGYLEPASAVVLSFLILHERMGVLQIIGAILIVAGVIYAENAVIWIKRWRHNKTLTK